MTQDARFWLAVVGAITATVAIIGAVVAISRWTGRVDTRLENLESAVKTLGKDIKKILRILPQPEVVSTSPLKLTEVGAKMAAFMKAQDWAGQIAPDLLPQVVNKQPFEIDLLARDFVAENLGEEMGRRVQLAPTSSGERLPGCGTSCTSCCATSCCGCASARSEVFSAAATALRFAARRGVGRGHSTRDRFTRLLVETGAAVAHT